MGNNLSSIQLRLEEVQYMTTQEKETELKEIIKDIFNAKIDITPKIIDLGFIVKPDIDPRLYSLFTKYSDFKYEYCYSYCNTSSSYEMILRCIYNLYRKYCDTSYLINHDYYDLSCKYMSIYFDYIYNMRDDDDIEEIYKAKEKEFEDIKFQLSKIQRKFKNRKIEKFCDWNVYEKFIKEQLFDLLLRFDINKDYEKDYDEYCDNDYDNMGIGSTFDRHCTAYICKSLRYCMIREFWQNMGIPSNKTKEVQECECGRYFLQSKQNNKKICSHCDKQRRRERTRECMRRQRALAKLKA